MGDALSAFGVVIAGAVIAVTHSSLADPVVSLLIGGLILWSSWGILTEAVNVLLEAEVNRAVEARERGEPWGELIEDLARTALENFARTHDVGPR